MDDDRYTRITLRIPIELHAKLQNSADRCSHSMNAEIILRLAQSYADTQPLEHQRIDELAEILAEKIATKLSAKKNKK
jgi:hypothetical protein